MYGHLLKCVWFAAFEKPVCLHNKQINCKCCSVPVSAGNINCYHCCWWWSFVTGKNALQHLSLQVGSYHSTKIWAFTMRHHCGCKITIQTDPKNAEYIVTDGARRKVESYDADDAQTIEIPDANERAAAAADPLASLERKTIQVRCGWLVCAGVQLVCSSSNSTAASRSYVVFKQLVETTASAGEN